MANRTVGSILQSTPDIVQVGSGPEYIHVCIFSGTHHFAQPKYPEGVIPVMAA